MIRRRGSWPQLSPQLASCGSWLGCCVIPDDWFNRDNWQQLQFLVCASHVLDEHKDTLGYCFEDQALLSNNWKLFFFLSLHYTSNECQTSRSVLQCDRVLPCAAIIQVYLLSGIRNDTLLEYVSLHSFTERAAVPPAKVVQLPFYWQGTGHVVYNGFLYCHKADTPNQILKVCGNRSEPNCLFFCLRCFLAFDCVARCMRVEWVETAE